MGDKVECPKLDWFERYKRLIDLGYRSILVADDYVYHRFGQEEWLKYLEETRPKWTGPVAKRIVEKNHLTPKMEDLVKLALLYSQEVWGYGDSRYVDAQVESGARGSLTAVGGCRLWALTPHEKRGAVPCHLACMHEMQGVVNALGTGFHVEVPRARPLGHENCEFVFTL